MKALLGVRLDGTIGLAVSSKTDSLTDDDIMEHVEQLVQVGWRNMVVLDTEPRYPGQLNCRLRTVETRIVG